MTEYRRSPPTQKALPLPEWPQDDREAWLAAQARAGVLDEGGIVSDLRRRTLDDLTRRYSYFLSFLVGGGTLTQHGPAAALVTEENILLYVRYLEPRVGSVTLAQSLYKIARVAACGFSKISAFHYGCSTARNKGTCDNLLTVRREELEAKVLDGLRDQLMHPELVTTFIDGFHKEVNRQRAEQDGHRDRTARDLEKTEREIRRVIEAIKAGVPGAAVKDEMTTLEARRVKLHAQFEAAPPPLPRLHPNLAELYRQKVMNLAEALNDEHTRLEAAECIRVLIEEIRLVPENGKLRVDLYGELAALINLANGHPRAGGTGVQVTLVAGTCNHRELSLPPVSI